MLNTTNYQRNANQNYSEVLHLTLVKQPSFKKATNNKDWRVCGEKIIPTVGWEYKLVQPLENRIKDP